MSSGDVIHMRPAVGSCELHDEPTEGLARKLVDAMRERHGKGGIDVCRPCVERARDDAAAGVLRAGR